MPGSTPAAVPAITPIQTSGTQLRVDGSGFPAHLPAKVVATFGSATRSAVVHVGSDGTYSVELTVPGAWAGSVQVSASADSGRVSVRQTVQLR
jgi:hypothetical protein